MGNQDSKGGQTPSSQPNKDAAKPDHPGFLQSHFGNPEGHETYGDGSNDYETEPEMIKEERTSANQAIWFTGAFLLLVAIAYLVFG